MGKLQDCERIVQEAVDGLGGLDIIISNAVRSAFLLSDLLMGIILIMALWLQRLTCIGLDKAFEFQRPGFSQ